MGRAILLRGGPGIGLRSAPRSPCRNVEDGTQPQGAPSVAKLSRCITKRFQPDYRRYLRTVSRCVRLPTHGFPSVVAFGGDDRASGRTRHSAEGRESTLPTCSRRTREFRARVGVRSGFWGICGCVAKTRDPTARLCAVGRCRFCCAPMRSWPRRQSSGAVCPAGRHQRQSKYRSDVGGH